MSYRYMRVLVFFDLPVNTIEDMREYRRFRKYLITNGFMMLQESVYCKLVPNASSADMITENLKKNKPLKGLVQLLKVTEKQFNKMDFIVGESNNEVIDTDERLIIL